MPEIMDHRAHPEGFTVKIVAGAIAVLLTLTGCSAPTATAPTAPTASGTPTISMVEVPQPTETVAKTSTTKPAPTADKALVAACGGAAAIISQVAASPEYTSIIAANNLSDLVRVGTASVKKVFGPVADGFHSLAKTTPGSANFRQHAAALIKTIDTASRKCVAAGAESINR